MRPRRTRWAELTRLCVRLNTGDVVTESEVKKHLTRAEWRRLERELYGEPTCEEVPRVVQNRLHEYYRRLRSGDDLERKSSRRRRSGASFGLDLSRRAERQYESALEELSEAIGDLPMIALYMQPFPDLHDPHWCTGLCGSGMPRLITFHPSRRQRMFGLQINRANATHMAEYLDGIGRAEYNRDSVSKQT